MIWDKITILRSRSLFNMKFFFKVPNLGHFSRFKLWIAFYQFFYYLRLLSGIRHQITSKFLGKISNLPLKNVKKWSVFLIKITKKVIWDKIKIMILILSQITFLVILIRNTDHFLTFFRGKLDIFPKNLDVIWCLMPLKSLK